MPLPQRVSQPTRDALAVAYPASYGSGPAAVALSDATAVQQRMPKPRVRAILRKVSDTYTAVAAVIEASVQRGVAVIADGGTDAVAGTVAGVPTVLTYRLMNAGSTLAEFSTVTLGTPVNGTVVANAQRVAKQPAITADGATVTLSGATDSVNAAVAGELELTVTVTPTIAGAWSCTISIVTNDADENPYNWTISGTAT